MKRKKVMAILMAGTMIFSCVGCGSTTKTEESDSTITGKVTEINDTSVTIQLGELMQGGGVPFEASDETKTLDLKDAEIVEESGQETETVDFEEIEVDDILVIQLGDDGTVESVTIKSGRMGGPGGFGGSGEVTQGTTEDATENNAEVTEESDTASEDGTVLSE